jgi:hypothetical protein
MLTQTACKQKSDWRLWKIDHLRWVRLENCQVGWKETPAMIHKVRLAVMYAMVTAMVTAMVMQTYLGT